MSANILTKDSYIENLIKKNAGIRVGLYEDQGMDGKKPTYGNILREPHFNIRGEKVEAAPVGSIVIPNSTAWENSEMYCKVWNMIEDMRNKLAAPYKKMNYNQFDPVAYYTLVNLLNIDITRRRVDDIDYTGLITNESTNEAMGLLTALQELLPYGGVFEEFKGLNEPAPLIQQRYGSKEAVEMHHYHIGHTRSLLDELYDVDIYSFQKVLAAVARAMVALRNDLSIGRLVALTTAGAWNALQTVSAVTTLGLTYDELVYQTWARMVRRLESCFDPQTNQTINSGRMVAIVGSDARAREMQKVISGQLNSIGAKTQALPALPISDIWVYKGDTIYFGTEKHVYPGVGENTAYLCVTGPDGSPWWTWNKRQLTREVGRGDVLRQEREKNVWYFAQTSWNREFLGTTDPDIAAAKATDFPNTPFGWVVTGSLPPWVEEET